MLPPLVRLGALKFSLLVRFTEETPVHSKLLLHYARRLCTKTGTLPPPDLQQLVTTEALVLVSEGCWLMVGTAVWGGQMLLCCGCTVATFSLSLVSHTPATVSM